MIVLFEKQRPVSKPTNNTINIYSVIFLSFFYLNTKYISGHCVHMNESERIESKQERRRRTENKEEKKLFVKFKKRIFKFIKYTYQCIAQADDSTKYHFIYSIEIFILPSLMYCIRITKERKKEEKNKSKTMNLFDINKHTIGSFQLLNES